MGRGVPFHKPRKLPKTSPFFGTQPTRKAEITLDQGLARSNTAGILLVTLFQGGKEEKKDAGPEAKAKGEEARKAIEEHRKALAKDGVHSCCIKPACTFCAAAGDMCPCAKNLTSGEAVCPECWGGWQAGVGRLEGIDPKTVKILAPEMLKKVYEMKAKSFEKVTGGADKK